MPLDATTYAGNMADDLETETGVDADGNVVGSLADPIDADAFAAKLGKHYDDYAAEGLVAGAMDTAGADAAKAIFQATDAASMGDALATYWAACFVTPDTPTDATVLTSVNNAASLSAAFTAAVQSSITDEASNPPYEAFILNVEAVVLTIVWTVTRNVAGTPTPTLTPIA